MQRITYLLLFLMAIGLPKMTYAIVSPPKNHVEALKSLMEGNRRFVLDQTNAPNRHRERREATASQQRPFAIVLGCSDSRVSPEIAFDQGLGDIFVVRVAGNVVSEIELASIEYSALVNHSMIVVVLGHENCGAVDAVVRNKTEGIEPIARLIEPALIKKRGYSKDLVNQDVKRNVQNSVKRIKESKSITKLMKEEKINVVGAYYALNTGEITLVNTD